MDLILKYFIPETLVGCRVNPLEESFHISFTLHIYYIIFFLKNQLKIFELESGVSTLHKAACSFWPISQCSTLYWVLPSFFILHIYYNIFFYKNQIADRFPCIFTPQARNPSLPAASLRLIISALGLALVDSRLLYQIFYQQFDFYSIQDGVFDITALYPAELPRQHCCPELDSNQRPPAPLSNRLIAVTVFLMEKVVWRRKRFVHITFFTLHIYYIIFFCKNQRRFFTWKDIP